jgi:hypothetical protein
MDKTSLIDIINSPGFFAISTIFINAIGWLVIYSFNIKKQEKTLKDEVRLDIYQKIADAKKDIDDSRNKLGLMLSKHGLPFLEMKWAQKRKDTDGLKGKMPNKIFLEYIRELSEVRHRFTNDYLNLWREIKLWIGVMPELKKPYEVLFKKLRELNDELLEYHNYLQSIQTEHGYDWQSWPQEEVEKKAEEVSQKFNLVTAYIDDFMVLAHNELLSPIVGVEKGLREEFSPNEEINYSVLTKNGIEDKEFSPDDSLWGGESSD